MPVTFWLWTLFVVNVAVGVWASPLTAVRRVRVIGAPPSAQARIEQTIQTLKGRPLVRVNWTALRYRLGLSSDVLSVSVLPNIFGRAVVKVGLRAPVAKIANSELFLDKTGTVFTTSNEPVGLPILQPPPRAFATNTMVVGSWECGLLAQLCQILVAQMPNVEWNVAVSDLGVISLQAESGAEVVMGSSNDLPQKVEKLKTLLEEKPDLLKRVRQLNLTSPDTPAIDRG